MHNETQNQNIDTQEVKVEDASVQTGTPQNQSVNTDQYRGPDVEEPADIDPKVTMNPEDLTDPVSLTETDPAVSEDLGDPALHNIGVASPLGTPPPEPIEQERRPLADELELDEPSATDWGDWKEAVSEPGYYWGDPGSEGWDSADSTESMYKPWISDPDWRPDEPSATDQVEPPDSEAAAPLSPEAVSMPVDKIVDPAGQAEPTPGGYDGSGIAGGLDLDGNGVFDQTENNPDIMSNNGEEQIYTYDENAYEDAEDALEDLQDALQDGDEEDLYEALEELQDYLGGFDKGDEEDQVQTDPEGHGSIPNVEQESPTFREESEEQSDSRPESSEDHDNHDDKEDKQDQNESPGNMSDDEVYTYDEDDYEEAEDALEDLRDALKHGNEEERAEALEDLQDYLGGFDKGGAEEAQTGEWVTGINGDVWVDASGKVWDSPKQAKAAAQLPQDEENDPHNHGDPRRFRTAVDKEPVDAPDASEAAVSGAAVGAAGAAVGAGAVGEADGLGETIGEALGVDGAGKVLGDLANGDLDGVIDAASESVGGAIDDALGIDGSGKILEDVVNGDFDGAIDAVTEQAGSAIDEALGIDGAGKVLGDLSEGDWGELGDHVGSVAGSYVGSVLGGPVGSAIGDKLGEFVGDGVGDAVTEELGDISTHIETGDYDEIAGDVLALNGGAFGGLLFGEHGAAVGQEIGEAVGDTVSEVVEGAGEVIEDVGEAVGDFFDGLW